jgi:translation initiation factor 2A
MPVVAHSKEGLLLDAFNDSGTGVPCQRYVLEGSRISWLHDARLSYYDLKEKKILLEMDVDDPKEIRMAEDGSIVGVLTYKNELLVLNAEGVNFRASGVSEFRVSSGLLAFMSQGSFVIHKIRGSRVIEEELHCSKIAILSFCVFRDFVALATKKLAKDGKHRILRIDGDAIDVMGCYDTIQNFSVKAHPSEKYLLFLLTTSYLKGGYFAESDIYFYNVEKKRIVKIDCEKVHHFTFLSGGFAICHGSQPSDVSIFSLSCRQISKLPRGTRNIVAFNQQENMAACCGFGNLSGDIEVFDTKAGRSMAKFAVLGASLVHWECNGTYFYISTTNYFQEDNRITMYDYYGRVVGERRFSSLISSQAYGEREDFIELEAPKHVAVKKEARYVPPSLKGMEAPVPASKPVRPRPRERTKEEVLHDLEMIQKLKERMRAGEELSIKELNLILREPRLSSELKKFIAE